MTYKFAFLIAFLVLAGCGSELKKNTTATVNRDIANQAREDASQTATGNAGGQESLPEIVIDVRSQEEWDSGHVEQALHIPHTEIAQRIAEVTEDKTSRIVVYCAVGGRAGKAKTTLEGLGFTNVENAGGYDDIKSRYSNP